MTIIEDKNLHDIGILLNLIGSPLNMVEGFARALMYSEEIGTLTDKQKEFVAKILEEIKKANLYRQELLTILDKTNE